MTLTKTSPDYKENLIEQKSDGYKYFYSHLFATILFLILSLTLGSFLQFVALCGLVYCATMTTGISLGWDSFFQSTKYIPNFDIGDRVKLSSCEFEELNPPLTVVKMTIKSYLLQDPSGKYIALKISNQTQYIKA